MNITRRILSDVRTVEIDHFWNNKGSYYYATLSVRKKAKDFSIYFIDQFIVDNHDCYFLWLKVNVVFIAHFFPLKKHPQINIFIKVTYKHPEVIEGRRWLTDMDLFLPQVGGKGWRNR